MQRPLEKLYPFINNYFLLSPKIKPELEPYS